MRKRILYARRKELFAKLNRHFQGRRVVAKERDMSIRQARREGVLATQIKSTERQLRVNKWAINKLLEA